MEETMGVLSLLPPVLAIALAMWTKQTILSLFIGVWIGATMLAGWNPIVGIVDTFREFILGSMADSWNASVLLMTLMVGGFAMLLERGGGAHAFAESMRKFVKNRRSAQIATWLGGLAIFFSDSTNPVVVGPVFKPITDRVRVSREKLAYIVDSTSASVPLLLPITAWGALAMSLMKTEFEKAGIQDNVMGAFMEALPFQFYTIAAILMVLIIAATNLEFGPMKAAEERAFNEGKLLRDGARPMRQDITTEMPKDARPTIWSMILPIAALLITLFSMFLWTGNYPERAFFEAIRNSSTMPSLIMAFFAASVVALIMSIQTKVFNFSDGFLTWLDGLRGMIEALTILVLAWSIGSVCSGVGTAPFVVSVAQKLVNPTLTYALIFIPAAFTSFSTGTSWGTFAIFMPIAIPLALAMDVSIFPAIAAVLSGGLFGDHCSPISDTTILSSIGSSCDHIDHVNTQLPYAMTAAFAATIGYLVAGFVASGIVTLAITLIVLIATVYGISLVKGRPLFKESASE